METMIEAIVCEPLHPDVYEGGACLHMRVVPRAERPRTREIRGIRSLGSEGTGAPAAGGHRRVGRASARRTGLRRVPPNNQLVPMVRAASLREATRPAADCQLGGREVGAGVPDRR
jgi:hypothetical protein